MKQASVMLATTNDVKEFASIISAYEFDIDIASGRYKVNAKSVMGIFSLDMTEPLTVEVHTDAPGDFFEKIAKFIVE